MSNIITWANSNITKYHLGLEKSLFHDFFLKTATPIAQTVSTDTEFSIKNASPYQFELSYSKPGGNVPGTCVSAQNKAENCLSAISSGAMQTIALNADDSWMILGYNVHDTAGQNIGGFNLFASKYQMKAQTIYGKECLVENKAVSNINEITCGQQEPDQTRNGIYNVPQEYSSGTKYRGINLTGAEWGGSINEMSWPDIELAQYYVEKGMNTIRFPIRWEYIQPDLNKPIDFTSPGYPQRVENFIKTLTNAGIHVILDLHNYMHYCYNMAPSDVNCHNIVTPEQMYNIWQQLSHQFKTNEFVIFDIMNEPSRLSTEQVLKNTVAALKAIQEEEQDGGVHNLVLIEGNGWTDGANWGDNWYDTSVYDKKSNAQVLTAENFKMSGITYDNIAINIHQYYGQLTGLGDVPQQCEGTVSNLLSTLHFEYLINWLKHNNFKAFLTETGAASNKHCADIIKTYLDAINDSGIFIGWTIWAGYKNPFPSLSNIYPTTDKIQFNDGIANYLTPLSEGSKHIRLVFEGELPSGNTYLLSAKSENSELNKTVASRVEGGKPVTPIVVEEWAYTISAESADGKSKLDCGLIKSNVIMLGNCKAIEVESSQAPEIPEHIL